MEWVDQGIILGTKRHGESSVIAEVMTRDRGRHQGLVRGGRGTKMQPLLQIGNQVEVTWRARLDEHLGQFQIEPVAFHAARLMENMMALHGLQLISSHLRLLPDRDPHPQLYEAVVAILEHFDEPAIAVELMARFELRLLEELGFGLDLSSCAATGATQDLIYVSPKSGRAVCRNAGAPWSDKLLALPQFLEDVPGCGVDVISAQEVWRLAAFFLDRDVWKPRALDPPQSRAAFQILATKVLAQPAA